MGEIDLAICAGDCAREGGPLVGPAAGGAQRIPAVYALEWGAVSADPPPHIAEALADRGYREGCPAPVPCDEAALAELASPDPTTDTGRAASQYGGAATREPAAVSGEDDRGCGPRGPWDLLKKKDGSDAQLDKRAP